MNSEALVNDCPDRTGLGHMARLMWSCLLAAMCLVGVPDAAAQGSQVVDGVVVNVGWARAADVAGIETERKLHRSHLHKKGVYHLVVTLSDARSGTPIRNATVTAAIDDPLDRVQRRTLKKAETAGFADYSDYYEFSAIGRYFLNLEIVLEGRSAPLKARFHKDYDGTQ